MAKTQKIKSLIVAKGLTQQKLAERLKMDKSTLSRKINNQSDFTIDEAKAMAKVLELDKNELSEIFFD